MDKYEQLALKIVDNMEFKDLVESYIYLKSEELKGDYDQFRELSKFYGVEE